MELKKIAKLISAIMLCQLAGIFGSVFTISAIPTWYAGLVKPEFAPPNWLFGPVWLTLYTLMGIALYLVWEKGFEKKENRIALGLFMVQLFLNAIWSSLFFGLRNPFYGLVCIIALWVFIVITMATFYRISKKAGTLLLPYLMWVSIAAMLNFYIWILN